MIGNGKEVLMVNNRGAGKTWVVAVCCLAYAVLWPGSMVAVISGTGEQATLVLRKIESDFIRNENVLREINCSGGRRPVSLTRAKGRCVLKNGSIIESFSIGTFRGNRAKLLIIDEAPEVNAADWEAVALPVLNTTRGVAIQHGFKDHPSAVCSITSACLKSNHFYDKFTDALKRIADPTKRSDGVFACALNWECSARIGITSREWFLDQKERMTEEKWMTEYESIFLGAESGSLFPYEKTQKCRTLKEVEVAMPAGSKADYVIAIDIAVSGATSADNTAISIIKLIDAGEGFIKRKLVYMRTYHGYTLTMLADELRRLLVKFPRTIKVVFDHHGVGNAFPQFLSEPWLDPNTGKEYPPLVLDTDPYSIQNAVPLLRAIDANNAFNQKCVNVTTIALEKGTLELPVESRRLVNGKIADASTERVTVSKDGTIIEEGEDNRHKLTTEEIAILYEADALQIEMGNIVSRPSASGYPIIGTAKSTQHKDRYSSLSYGLAFIADLEDERTRKYRSGSSDECIVLVDYM